MTLRLTVHCIGLCSEGVIFQRHKHSPLQWICVQWDNLVAGLISPFFDHEVELQQNSQGQYTLFQWHSVQCRLPQDGSDWQQFSKKVRECLKQSFFPLLVRMTNEDMQVEQQQYQYWPWEMRQKPLSTQCSEPHWWTKVHTVAATHYWHWHREHYKEQVKPILSVLDLKFCNSLTALYGLLDRLPRLQQHWAPYVKHRLLDMDSLFTVCCHNDWLQLQVATLSPGTVQDLARLHQQFRQLARGRLRETAKNPPPYNNLASLLRHTLSGKVSTMIKHYLPTIQSPLVKLQLLDQILVRGMAENFESQSMGDQSTCFPITFKSLHWHYHSLMQLPCSDQDLQQLLPFNLEEEEESEFHQLLARFRHLAQSQQRLLAWFLVPHKVAWLIKPYTPLFVIHSRPEELSRERLLQKLWQDLQSQRQVRVHQPPVQWNVEEWRQELSQMDDIDKQLYRQRWTLLFYSPSEMAASLDMKVVQELLESDFYGTSLIRPKQSEWTVRRLNNHFQHHCTELEPQELHERLHFATDERAQRETVVVLDAHLYSYSEMQTLLQWLNDCGQIKLVVMIGAFDTHPLHGTGHAMLDLAQWHDRASVQTHLFAHQYRQSQFQELLTKVNHHCIEAWHQLQDLLQKLQGEKNSLTLILIDQLSLTRKFTELQQRVEENLTKKFTLAHNLTVKRQGLDSLFMLQQDEESRHVFITTRHFMQELKRNELNHLFVEQDCLIIVGDRGKKSSHSLDWLAKQVERLKFPNMRHTLPYLCYCENSCKYQ